MKNQDKAASLRRELSTVNQKLTSERLIQKTLRARISDLEDENKQLKKLVEKGQR